MEKPKITPGTWTVSALQPADGKYIFQGEDVNPICALAEWNEEGVLQHDFFPENQAANAKAISAVPEMLDVLIKIHRYVKENQPNYLLSSKYTSLGEIESALKKAGAL